MSDPTMRSMGERRGGWRACRRAGAVAVASLVVATVAHALDVVAVSPDVTLDLGASVLTDEGAVLELGSGAVPVDLGPLPQSAAVIALDVVDGSPTLFALDTHVELDGTTYRPGDVIGWDGVTHSLFWDADAAGLPASARVDGLALAPDASLYLSFDVDVELGGTVVQDHDVLRVSSGGGLFVFFSDSFDDWGVRHLDVDAVTWLSAEKIGLSFDQAGSVDGVAFDDVDVVSFDVNDETWALVFDASSANAAYVGAADIDAVTVPEPTLGLLLGSGALALCVLDRSRRDRAAGRSSTA